MKSIDLRCVLLDTSKSIYSSFLDFLDKKKKPAIPNHTHIGKGFHLKDIKDASSLISEKERMNNITFINLNTIRVFQSGVLHKNN